MMASRSGIMWDRKGESDEMGKIVEIVQYSRKGQNQKKSGNLSQNLVKDISPRDGMV